MAGMITWHELFTTDVDRAIPFYTELLGAEIETASMGDFEYQMLNKDGRSHAGFVKDERGVAPSHWYPYIHSDDVDASVQAATAAGAQLIHGPMDVADMLRFAVLGDPQHATFGLISRRGQPAAGPLRLGRAACRRPGRGRELLRHRRRLEDRGLHGGVQGVVCR